MKAADVAKIVPVFAAALSKALVDSVELMAEHDIAPGTLDVCPKVSWTDKDSGKQYYLRLEFGGGNGEDPDDVKLASISEDDEDDYFGDLGDEVYTGDD